MYLFLKTVRIFELAKSHINVSLKVRMFRMFTRKFSAFSEREIGYIIYILEGLQMRVTLSILFLKSH